jgi:hypothetical protein
VGRVSGTLGAVALGALLAGCGGSVADADTRGAAPPTARAASAEAGPFCAAVTANADAIRPLTNLSLRTPVAADQLTAAVQAARLSGTVMLDAAPSAIRPDVQRTVDALDTELNALLAAGGDVQAVARDPRVSAQVDSPEVTAAGRRVAVYVSQNCGQSR